MHMSEIFLNCAPNFDSKFSAEKLDPICLNPEPSDLSSEGLAWFPWDEAN